MKREGDFLTANLFEEPQPGERGHLREGFHFEERDAKVVIVDQKGNVYDEQYALLEEAPSEDLVFLRKKYPGLSNEELQPYLRAYRAEKLHKERERSETARLRASDERFLKKQPQNKS